MARRNKRVSPETLRALWARWKQGESVLEISQALGVGHTWDIIRGRGGVIPPARVRSARVRRTGGPQPEAGQHEARAEMKHGGQPHGRFPRQTSGPNTGTVCALAR